jgi:hypothetical protein
VSDELFFCEELALLLLPSALDWFGKGSSTGVLLGIKNEPLPSDVELFLAVSA